VLLEEIRVPGIRIVEKTLMPADLETADEVFITSTTRDLLPVVRIEDKSTGRSERLRTALQEAFSAYVSRYITEHKPAVAPPAAR
jgi:branched-subunit amino acid aminotransferase/4-amino-4-deoxychorismate lyase